MIFISLLCFMTLQSHYNLGIHCKLLFADLIRPLQRIESPYQNPLSSVDSSLSSKDVISILKAQISYLR